MPNGRGTDGYPYVIDVDTLIVLAPNAVWVAGTVRSPQVPVDNGGFTGFIVIDHGNGAADPPDELWQAGQPNDYFRGGPIHSGNFTVR